MNTNAHTHWPIHVGSMCVGNSVCLYLHTHSSDLNNEAQKDFFLICEFIHTKNIIHI